MAFCFCRRLFYAAISIHAYELRVGMLLAIAERSMYPASGEQLPCCFTSSSNRRIEAWIVTTIAFCTGREILQYDWNHPPKTTAPK